MRRRTRNFHAHFARCVKLENLVGRRISRACTGNCNTRDSFAPATLQHSRMLSSKVRTMKRVLIFGATAPIAADAARLYAERGDRLHLVGRNPEKLAAVAERCAATTVTTTVADLADLDRNDERVRAAIEALGRVDVALIAHGDLGDQLATE